MTISCPKCSGQGKIKLFDALSPVLAIIQELGTPTIAEIYQRSKDRKRVTSYAVNRRVERLVKLGLVKKVAKSQPPRYQLV